MKIPTNCMLCAKCCINAVDNKWIEVTPKDEKVVPKEFLAPGDIEKFAMKQNRDGRCACLGVGNKCQIYDKRPTICRTVQPGDSYCRNSITRYDLLLREEKAKLFEIEEDLRPPRPKSRCKCKGSSEWSFENWHFGTGCWVCLGCGDAITYPDGRYMYRNHEPAKFCKPTSIYEKGWIKLYDI